MADVVAGAWRCVRRAGRWIAIKDIPAPLTYEPVVLCSYRRDLELPDTATQAQAEAALRKLLKSGVLVQ